MRDEAMVKAVLATAEKEFVTTNKKRLKKDQLPIAVEELQALHGVLKGPLHIAIIDALDNWVIETRKDSARAPNDDEWKRFLASPLDGMIGMSLALQWRYNFGPLFGAASQEEDEDNS
jgi:hypothetical protein